MVSIEDRLRKGDPTVTIGEKYTPAMTMRNCAEASKYFRLCVRHSMAVGGLKRPEAESNERQSLGYYAGYYDQETRERVERLFFCEHPIFGKARNEVTPARAMRLGRMLAGTDG